MNKIFFALLVLVLHTAPLLAQLPNVTLKNINGKIIKIDTISNNNKPIIISFFATWCKPCNRELNAISEVYEQWQKETGVKLIAISIDKAQDINRVKPLVDANEWSYEVLLDSNGELRRALGAQVVPFVVVLNKNKHIVYKHNGYNDGDEEQLFEEVKKALNQ